MLQHVSRCTSNILLHIQTTMTVKTVVSIDPIRMLRTDCSGETRLALART